VSVTLSDPKSRIDGAAASSTAVHATVTGVDAKGQMFRRPAAILILDGRDCTFRTDCQPEPNGSVLVEYDDRQSGIKRQVLHASVKATAPDTVSGFYKVTVQLEVAQTTKIFATSVEPRRVIETPNAVESGGVAESRNVSAKPSPSSQPANQAAQPASPAAKVGPALMTRDLLSTPPVNGASQPVARSIHQTIAEAKDENPTSMSKPQAENPIAMREAVRSAVAAELKQELAILKTWMSGEMERTVPGIIASNTEKIIRDNVEKHSAAAHEKTTQVFSAKVAGLVEDQIAGFRASLDSTVKKLAEEQAQLSQNAAGNSDKELTSRAATLLRSLEESASELTKKLLAEQTEFARTAAERADIELSSRAAATARSLEETTAAMARNVFEQQAELSRTAHSSAQHELDSHAATILRSLQESTSEMATKLAHEQAELLRNIHNDAQEDLGLGSAAWRDLYIAQGEQKQAQIEAMIRYAQSDQCRMSSLVLHFGDTADSRKPCGICDFCAPESCVAQKFRAANKTEQAVARAVLNSLLGSGRSLGKLHTELCSTNGLDRDAFEELMGAMARSGLIRLVDSVFEKDGKTIPFRKASLTRDAEYVNEGAPLELSIRETAVATQRKGRRKKAAAVAKKAPKKNIVAESLSRPAGKVETPPDHAAKAEAMLKEWRRGQAKKLNVPAFRIMSNRTLSAIAENQPRSAAELLAIPGIGIKLMEKYGAQIYRILDEARR